MLLNLIFNFFFTICFLVVLLPVTQQNIVRTIISLHFQNIHYPFCASLEPEMLQRDELSSQTFDSSCSALGFAVWYLLMRSLCWTGAWINRRLQLALPVKNWDFMIPHVQAPWHWAAVSICGAFPKPHSVVRTAGIPLGSSQCVVAIFRFWGGFCFPWEGQQAVWFG